MKLTESKNASICLFCDIIIRPEEMMEDRHLLASLVLQSICTVDDFHLLHVIT